ncbi:MAG: hypothetical protein EOP62_21510 [Sphingomonadales bacterium]|jgi:hypothetical protein|nr:MAG: hypothetical protein EOP62_21510 [Sphingomonadales bacterium]
MDRLNASKRSSAALMSALIPMMMMLVSCAGGRMKSHYPKDWVESLEVSKVSDDELKLRFFVPAESLYYAAGVNYEVQGDALRVAIERCSINESCSPMVKRAMPMPQDQIAELRLPYAGKVILVHADQEEQIYP